MARAPSSTPLSPAWPFHGQAILSGDRVPLRHTAPWLLRAHQPLPSGGCSARLSQGGWMAGETPVSLVLPGFSSLSPLPERVRAPRIPAFCAGPPHPSSPSLSALHRAQHTPAFARAALLTDIRSVPRPALGSTTRVDSTPLPSRSLGSSGVPGYASSPNSQPSSCCLLPPLVCVVSSAGMFFCLLSVANSGSSLTSLISGIFPSLSSPSPPLPQAHLNSCSCHRLQGHPLLPLVARTMLRCSCLLNLSFLPMRPSAP